MKRGRIRNLAIVLFSVLLFGSTTIYLYSPASRPAEAAGLIPEAPVPGVVAVPQDTAIAESLYQIFQATAYCINGITFSGVAVQRGIIAADPQILPIGSVVEVRAGDYSGIYTVMDTGAVIKGSIIDIYVPDYEEAIQFGRQKVRLRVLRHGWNTDPADLFSHGVAG